MDRATHGEEIGLQSLQAAESRLEPEDAIGLFGRLKAEQTVYQQCVRGVVLVVGVLGVDWDVVVPRCGQLVGANLEATFRRDELPCEDVRFVDACEQDFPAVCNVAA
jgi:hypothetical protein